MTGVAVEVTPLTAGTRGSFHEPRWLEILDRLGISAQGTQSRFLQELTRQAPEELDRTCAFLSTAPGRRREEDWTWTWTWMDADTCAWAQRRRPPKDTPPCSSLPSLSCRHSTVSLHTPASPTPRALTNVTRDDDGAPGQGTR